MATEAPPPLPEKKLPWYRGWIRKHPTYRKKPTRSHILGPGLVTGASDDDPSGIATYSQAGAQFGYGLLWTMPFAYPLMSGIQEISARIGRVTGKGVAGNLRQHYSRGLVFPAILLFVAANVVNLGANIAAMGAALRLIIGGPALLYSLLFVIASLALQISFPYQSYARYLKVLTLSLMTYIATAFIIDVDWVDVAINLLPRLQTDAAYIGAFVAIMGTTISPYLFFWQASEEVEETKAHEKEHKLTEAPWQADKQFRRIRIDTLLGMAFSQITAFFIILVCAVTLNQEGITDIGSADQAAEALRPSAGQFAFLLFAIGIIGTGLLALPILGGSAAYAVGEVMRWSVGLAKSFNQARSFYLVLATATLIGLALNLIGVNPVDALFLSALINGIVAPPLMALMILAASNKKVMGRFTLSLPLKILGWTVVAVMAAASIALLVTSVIGA